MVAYWSNIVRIGRWTWWEGKIFFSSGIFQNPLLVSSLLKTVVPDNCERVSSIFGRGWSLRNMLWLRGLRSTRIRTIELFLFRTTNIPAHHNVGLSTFKVTPSDFICASWSVTFLRSGKGTWLGAIRANGLALGFGENLYSSPKFSKPWKVSGKRCGLRCRSFKHSRNSLFWQFKADWCCQFRGRFWVLGWQVVQGGS